MLCKLFRNEITLSRKLPQMFLIRTSLFYFLDKHPQLNEFLTQIKNTPDLANLFESIQKDSSASGSAEGGYSGYSSGAGAMSMDLS